MSIEGLSTLCTPYGSVTQIRLKKDSHTGVALGYAFVHFDSPAHATAAAQALDGLQMGNKVIRVQIAKTQKGGGGPPWRAGGGAGAAASAGGIGGGAVVGIGGAVVEVTGLARGSTASHVQRLLEVYGQLSDVSMMEAKAGSSNTAASVRFSELSAATAAVQALNGVQLPGASEPLSLRLAPHHDRSSSGSSVSSAASTPQRSRRSSALNDSFSSPSSASPIFYHPYEAQPSGQGHVQAIPGGFAVYPAQSTAQYSQEQSAPQPPQPSHPPTFFPSAESYGSVGATAGATPPGTFNAEALYAAYQSFYPTQSSSSSSPLSSGQSTPASSYLPQYHQDPSAFYHHYNQLMQQSPHMLAHRSSLTTAPASSPSAPSTPSLYPHPGMLPPPYDEAHPPFHPSSYPQSISSHPPHTLMMPSLLLPSALNPVPYSGLHLPHSTHPPSHSSSSSSHLPHSHSPFHSHVRPPLERPGICLFVFHLPPDLSDPALLTLFSHYGVVLSCKVITNPQTGASKGYGFVNFATLESAKAAIQGLNGYKLGTKFLKVQFKKTRQGSGG